MSHACMDGRMDGWMDVTVYIYIYIWHMHAGTRWIHTCASTDIRVRVTRPHDNRPFCCGSYVCAPVHTLGYAQAKSLSARHTAVLGTFKASCVNILGDLKYLFRSKFEPLTSTCCCASRHPRARRGRTLPRKGEMPGSGRLVGGGMPRHGFRVFGCSAYDGLGYG